VWTTAEAAAAVRNNTWPVPGVPNPISRSVRFRSSVSAYFNRTVGAGNQQKWTWSGWVKFGSFTTGGGVRGAMFLYGTLRTSNYTTMGLNPADNGNSYQFGIESVVGTSGGSCRLFTTAVLRDPSAWYHLIMSVDTTQATAANRIIIYINGVQQAITTVFTPAQNLSMYINENGVNTGLGAAYTTTYAPFDGYMTEVNFIDGQQLTPSSFGTTDPLTGAWEPMPYTGTYGTNGFYLNFKDATSTATLGLDYSGNSNHFTATAISLTAGVTYDSMVDVPTLWSPYTATGEDTGALVRGNYAVWNPLASPGTITSGNLNVSATTTGATSTTFFQSTGKWYWEVVCTSAVVTNTRFGIINPSGMSTDLGGNANGWAYLGDGRVYHNGASASYGVSYATNDILMIALDIDAGKIWYGKNGTWMASGVPATGTSPSQSFTANQLMSPAVASGSGTFAYVLNCGQRPFSYTPPTGFKSLNTFNLPEPTIKQGATSFAATLYTGNGSTLSIDNSVNGVSFQPDFVWVKGRSGATSHALYDFIRGATKDLVSNSTASETTQATGLTAFGSTGFTVGSLAKMNTNAATYVAWQWKATGATVSNTNGSITSTVSASTAAGFSIVTYTGTGTTGTVGHGLGSTPQLIINKIRLTSAGENWPVYTTTTGPTNYLALGSTIASSSATIWNNTAPTSSVFSVLGGNWANINGNTYITYCFVSVDGYSKIGSYTGNGSADGPFVYLGFRPRFIMIKRTDAANAWIMFDTSRSTYNQSFNYLLAENTQQEIAASGSTDTLDFLSNGFKLRCTTLAENASGGTYIYMAFAENPFKYSNAR
jgi:hypothetical protein